MEDIALKTIYLVWAALYTGVPVIGSIAAAGSILEERDKIRKEREMNNFLCMGKVQEYSYEKYRDYF